jgi:hypothetical protein
MNLGVTETAKPSSTQAPRLTRQKEGEALGSGGGDQIQISAGELDCLTSAAGTIGVAGRRVEQGVLRGAAPGLNDSLCEADDEHDAGSDDEAGIQVGGHASS